MTSRPAQFFDVPLLRYVGAKWQIAHWITQFFPSHDCYVEPYAGSAAVFFRKPPSPIEVLNDMNNELVNFWRMLRERPKDLIHAIEFTPFSRQEYALSYEKHDDPLEAARRFYVRCWQSFGGSEGRRTGFRFQKNLHRGTDITHEWSRTTGLWFAAQELKHAIIEQSPALEIIARYDTPRTLFYIDPPYVLSARAGYGRKRYQHEMTDNDHRVLADALKNIQGAAVVSGYPSALYDELFDGWRCYTRTTTTNGNGQATECVWLHPRITTTSLSRQIEQLSLFEV